MPRAHVTQQLRVAFGLMTEPEIIPHDHMADPEALNQRLLDKHLRTHRRKGPVESNAQNPIDRGVGKRAHFLPKRRQSRGRHEKWEHLLRLGLEDHQDGR